MTDEPTYGSAHEMLANRVEALEAKAEENGSDMLHKVSIATLVIWAWMVPWGALVACVWMFTS